MTLNSSENNFFYLNRLGRWADFELDGLEIGADGSLHLATVPRLLHPLPWLPTDPPRLNSGAAGITVDGDGRLFFTQPQQNRLMRNDHCDVSETAVACISGGKLPTQLRRPRGLAYDPHRQALVVADSKNGRVQLFDPQTYQLLGLYDGFEEPVDVAADGQGFIYIADAAANAIIKIDKYGRRWPGFSQRIHKKVPGKKSLAQPIALDTAVLANETHLYVLDGEKHTVFVFQTDGELVTHFGGEQLQQPMGLAVTETAVYVGDNQLQRILKFKNGPEFTYVGTAVHYQGPVAALAAVNDELWVHPGDDRTPLPLKIGAGFVREGICLSQPLHSPRNAPVRWQRLKAFVAQLSDETSLQMFVQPGTEAVIDLTDMQAVPLNVDDAFMADSPAAALSVAVRLTGDGETSPSLSQLLLAYDQDTYRMQLPALFSQNEDEVVFLDRFLTLFETVYDDAEYEITNLDRYLSPEATPEAWLPWLANWVSLNIDERWTEAAKRTAVAQAVPTHQWRGTTAGLRTALKKYAGVDALIIEPLQQANWWQETEEGTALGFDSRLSDVNPGPAIVGSTATLGAVSLIAPEDYGVPLFEGVAHRFVIYLYRGQVNDDILATVQAVVAAEKPAHTDYLLAIVEPTMRLGQQSTLGIDAVLAKEGHMSEASLDSVQLAGKAAMNLDNKTRLGKNSTI